MVDAVDIGELHQLIENHRELTGSAVADRLLNDWESSLKLFKKVIPTDYKRCVAVR